MVVDRIFVCGCTCTYVCIQAGACVWACVWGQRSTLGVVYWHFPRWIFCYTVSHWLGVCKVGYMGWSASLRDSPASTLPAQVLHACATMPGFSCGFWGQNLGPCFHGKHFTDSSHQSSSSESLYTKNKCSVHLTEKTLYKWDVQLCKQWAQQDGLPVLQHGRAWQSVTEHDTTWHSMAERTSLLLSSSGSLPLIIHPAYCLCLIKSLLDHSHERDVHRYCVCPWG